MSTRIRTILVIALGLMIAIFSGCGGGGESASSEGTPLPAGTALPSRVLSWEPPTSYVDATGLNPVTDLDRYEIYVKETDDFSDADTPMAAVSEVTTSFDLANLSSDLTVGPQYHVSMRAVALTGLKSDFSPPVSFSF